MASENHIGELTAREPGAGGVQRGRALIATGTAGVTIAAICCATPLLAIALGAIGLTAWLASADYVLLAVFIAGLALMGLGFYRRRLGTAHDK